METVNSTGPMQATQGPRPLDARQKLRLQHAVKEFEAVLVGYMLKSMRSSIPKEEMSGEGYGAGLMEGMFDIELARHVSRGSNLGLGEMLYKKITGEEMPSTVPTSHQGTPGGLATSAAASAQAGESVLSATASSGRASDSTRTAAPGTSPRKSTATGYPVLPGMSSESSLRGPSQEPSLPDTVRQRVESLSPIISEAAQEHGVDAQLLKAVIATESAGRVTAQSPKRAKGLMQLIDSTATAMGVRNVWDPRQNVQGGAKYLGQLLERFQGNVENALASYNAGPGAVDRYQGIPPYKETQEYVERVLQYLRDFSQQEPAPDDDN